jgi:Terminase RNaseH-like domain/Terminase large subunit, T4likevirus-type, N-terminal
MFAPGTKKITPVERAERKRLEATLKRYLANPRLKAVGQRIPFELDQIEELAKCKRDAVYFVQHYVKIVNVDHGLIPIVLYPKQVEMIETCQKNRFVILKASRQVGKTTTVAVGYLLWYILFHSDKRVGILANKEDTAIEIASRLRIAYQNLPLWIQQGVVEWSKTKVMLENGSGIMASSTSSSAIRGWSINVLYLDEFAHVPSNVADDFFSSVFPTISSGKTTQVIVTSTPYGMNLFWRLCKESPGNGFVMREYDWRAVPWRTDTTHPDYDPEWETRERAVLKDKFDQEHLCEFLGSIGTLISGKVLRTLAGKQPIRLHADNCLKVYEEPVPGRLYLMTVDTSYGKELDSSAFIVWDITTAPYRIVALFSSNEVASQLYPNIIYATGRHYNDAWVFAEANDVGAQVLAILQNDLEYPTLIFTEDVKNGNKELKYSSQTPGIRTSPKIKRQACMALKSIVESYEVIIDDFDCIDELSTFIAKKNKTYGADKEKNDDLCTCMWLMAWLTTQQFFKDLTNEDLRKRMFKERAEAIDQSIPPAPMIQRPMQPPTKRHEVSDGVVWEIVGEDNPLGNPFGGRYTGLGYG